MSEQKFICDFMLGRLAKWLRLLGFDTVYYNNPDDPGILHRALKEGRIILSRSKEIIKYKNSILIKSENIEEQLKQLKEIIKINTPLSRCPECNTSLNTINKEDIKDEVPKYIYKIHSDFKRCPDCGKIFWKGTHYREIKRKIDELKI